jgi:hypothetical protein
VIDAKADGNPTKDQMRLMMQSLLADRFKLRAHFETKQVPVLALTLVKPGKLGPKLLPHSEGPPCPDTSEILNPLTTPPPALPKAGDVFPANAGLLPKSWQPQTVLGRGSEYDHGGCLPRIFTAMGLGSGN